VEKEIKLAGFGGQGIVLAGYILGKALSVYDGKNAALTQSYGPEARGGACSADVVMSSESVDYPKVISPDVLIVMGQEAYHTYIGLLKEGGILIYDKDLVAPNQNDLSKVKSYPVPATRIAEEKIGRRIVANIVMLGAFTSITQLVSRAAMEESIRTSVRKEFVEMNLRAFKEGLEYAKTMEVKV